MSASLFRVGFALLVLSGGNAMAGSNGDARGLYAITNASRIAFFVGQVGGGGIAGVIPEFSGTFELYPQDLAHSRVSITLVSTSVMTGQPRVEQFLRSPAVFDADRYPRITFRSVKVIPTGPESARIEGMLSARGKTRRETFDARLTRHTGREIEFHVVGDVLRSPYGMDVGTPIYSNVVKFDMILRGERRDQ